MRLTFQFLTVATAVTAVILFGHVVTSPGPDTARRTGPPIDPAIGMPPQVAEFVMRSCADCHTNFTKWPWYAKLPPASEMMMHDVAQARQAMNLTEWSSQVHSKAHGKGLLQAACAVVQAGAMPLPKYLLLHPGARPTATEVQMFCDWTRQAQPAVNSTVESAGR